MLTWPAEPRQTHKPATGGDPLSDRLRREKRLEDVGQDRGIDADAVVAHRHHRIRAGCDLEICAARASSIATLIIWILT